MLVLNIVEGPFKSLPPPENTLLEEGTLQSKIPNMLLEQLTSNAIRNDIPSQQSELEDRAFASAREFLTKAVANKRLIDDNEWGRGSYKLESTHDLSIKQPERLSGIFSDDRQHLKLFRHGVKV